MNVFATVRARMGSGRLPGKVLLEAAGKPLLQHLVDRLRTVDGLDGLVVATSTNLLDDPIEDLCDLLDVPCFRGSEANVLERMLDVVRRYKIGVNVEIMGDNPILDPALVDTGLKIWNSGDYDLVTNQLVCSYPTGMEFRIHSAKALSRASRMVEDDSEREHGAYCIMSRPTHFRILNFEADGTDRRPDLSLEVDTEVDFNLVRQVCEGLRHIPNFGLADILGFLSEHPMLARLNQDVERRWRDYFSSDIPEGVRTIPVDKALGKSLS